MNKTSIPWVLGPDGAPGFAWNPALAQRFWGYVNKSGAVSTGMTTPCWLWTAGRFQSSLRYGQFRVGAKKMRAHRVSFLLKNGTIPDGLLVLHKCDNPICCNPDHLFVGTSLDNARDRDMKGRAGVVDRFPDRSGERNPAAKIGWARVRTIRQEHASGATVTELSRKHGISCSQIRNIVAMKCWKEST